MEKILSELERGNILILGFAREGVSTYNFLRKFFPAKKITIADKKGLHNLEGEIESRLRADKNLSFKKGSDYLADLGKYDIVIKSPGVPSDLPEIKKAEKEGVRFTSQTKIFFEVCEDKIVGVTGTKGKSTTSTLIYYILKESGIDCELIGNIGKPPLDYLAERGKYFVFELSSHQLATLEKSPFIAVFLNIFIEHLDYYKNFDHYLAAKENITKFQSNEDVFIYNTDIPEASDIARRTKAQKLEFSMSSTKANCFLEEGFIVLREKENKEKVIKVGDVPLLGNHNLYNVMAAVLASYTTGATVEDIRRAIKTFRPLPDRLEVVGVFKNITFVNDALATIPEATIAALKAFNGKVGTLICGGFDRGQKFETLAEVITEMNVENLILFPETGKKIWQEVKKRDAAKRHFFIDTMEDAVRLAYEITSPGKICLLSAASPSFTVFKNYEDEANQYKKYVAKYSKLS